MSLKTTPFTYASRADLDLNLTVFEGTLPQDLSGFAFFNSPVGTVNNTTPIPEYRPDGTYNPEYGQMVFNGDGMLLRFAMDTPGEISVKTKLLKTPCYYADEASKYGTDYFEQGLKFNSQGMARTSLSLGSRNQINTSVNTFKFSGDKTTRVTVNFDAGRPFEIDPKSLELITPIGRNSEWGQEMSPILENTFELFQSSAHPSFDPITQEFFTVCFQKNFNNLILGEMFPDSLLEEEHHLKEKLEMAFASVFGKIKLSARNMLRVLKNFVEHAHKQVSDKSLEDYNLDHAENAIQAPDDFLGMVNATYLMRWVGQDPLDRWNIIDEEGNNLTMMQTMHQTALSKDYIVLVDSSLKFALDVLENVPFPKLPWLNRLLRWITARTIEPTTPLYIIKRSDLIAGEANVVAKKFIIPLETVHYSVLYDNPDNNITIFTSHNSALCAAEWVRPYDVLAVDKTPIDKNTIGLFTCGEMDLGRVGKFVVNGETCEIVEQIVVSDKGFDGDNVKNITRAHTWAVGLNTFRDELSADNPNYEIPYIFWQFYGLDKRMLTEFIKELYEKYQNRIISVEDMLKYTDAGVPFCISRMRTDNMEFDDYYLFKMNENLRSLQFVPRKAGSENHHSEIALDGYILCTMINGPENFVGDDYTREIWVFDAANLAQGPVAKLNHPDLQYAFTIHSVWTPDCEPSPANYVIDIVEDYTQVVNAFPSEKKRNQMLQFLQATVFPHYQN